MDISNIPSATLASSGPTSGVAINTALLSELNTAQVKNVETLFSSLGVGTNADTSA